MFPIYGFKSGVQRICLQKRLVPDKDAHFSFSCLGYSRAGYEAAAEIQGVPVSHVTMASLQIMLSLVSVVSSDHDLGCNNDCYLLL